MLYSTLISLQRELHWPQKKNTWREALKQNILGMVLFSRTKGTDGVTLLNYLHSFGELSILGY